MPATTKTAAPAGADKATNVAPLLTVTRRPPLYRVDKDATRGATGEGSFVTRGVHIKTGAHALVHVDGSTQSALPLGVIGAAILHGVISDSEILALQGLRK